VADDLRRGSEADERERGREEQEEPDGEDELGRDERQQRQAVRGPGPAAAPALQAEREANAQR
jgi:hypothetical protein